jgi:hypothetical protein
MENQIKQIMNLSCTINGDTIDLGKTEITHKKETDKYIIKNLREWVDTLDLIHIKEETFANYKLPICRDIYSITNHQFKQFDSLTENLKLQYERTTIDNYISNDTKHGIIRHINSCCYTSYDGTKDDRSQTYGEWTDLFTPLCRYHKSRNEYQIEILSYDMIRDITFKTFIQDPFSDDYIDVSNQIKSISFKLNNDIIFKIQNGAMKVHIPYVSLFYMQKTFIIEMNDEIEHPIFMCSYDEIEFTRKFKREIAKEYNLVSLFEKEHKK